MTEIQFDTRKIRQICQAKKQIERTSLFMAKVSEITLERLKKNVRLIG